MYSQSSNGAGANPGSYNPATQDQTPRGIYPHVENYFDPTQVPSHPGDTFRAVNPNIQSTLQQPQALPQPQPQPQPEAYIPQLIKELKDAVLQQQLSNRAVGLSAPAPMNQFASQQVVAPKIQPIEIPIKVKLKIEIDITPIVGAFRQEEEG